MAEMELINQAKNRPRSSSPGDLSRADEDLMQGIRASSAGMNSNLKASSGSELIQLGKDSVSTLAKLLKKKTHKKPRSRFGELETYKIPVPRKKPKRAMGKF